jgi:archaetidylinositol phosphate synthase
MSSTTPGVHVRQHTSILAVAEKRLLIAIAQRLPACVTSDVLTLLGLFGMLAVGTGFALMRWSPTGAVVVVVGLCVNWFGDSLDGTVARVRRQERPRYGYYVDHVLDVAGAAIMFTGLALSGLMSPLTATAVLAAYLLVSAESYLATHVSGIFRLSAFGVGPTELRIVLGAGAITAARRPTVSIFAVGVQPLFEIGGVIATGGLLYAFVDAAVRQIRVLAAAEGVRRGSAPVDAKV